MFRPELERALAYSDGAKGGRPPFDPVMMFKVLVIQTANTLSDERTEYLINDRLSFMRFLGLGLSDRVPDAAHDLAVPGEADQGRRDRAAVRPLRRDAAGGRLHRHVRPDRRCHAGAGAAAAEHAGREGGHQGRPGPGGVGEQAGQAPAQGPRRTLDGQVHQGQSRARTARCRPSTWPFPAFGYRNHIAIDRRFGLIRKWLGTDAAATRAAGLREGLLDKTNTAAAVWGDTAYRSATNEAFMAENGFVSRIHRKKPANRPMSRNVRRANNAKSRIRAHVEHVFAEQKDRMDLFIRTIGIARATTKIGLANLVYNLKRLITLRRLEPA